MDIVILKGTEKRLYDMVARLVMSPAILRQNNNYPFKTSLRYVWYIALDDNVIQGFLPVKNSSTGSCIDNYYIKDDCPDTLDKLVKAVVTNTDGLLWAVVHKRHIDCFRELGFITCREWNKYDRMQYVRKEGGNG